MKRRRLTAELRKGGMLEAALKLAVTNGYNQVTREQVALATGVTGPAVQYHFKTMVQFRRSLLRLAIQQECLPVIAQALVVNDPLTIKIRDDLKARARASI